MVVLPIPASPVSRMSSPRPVTASSAAKRSWASTSSRPTGPPPPGRPARSASGRAALAAAFLEATVQRYACRSDRCPVLAPGVAAPGPGPDLAGISGRARRSAAPRSRPVQWYSCSTPPSYTEPFATSRQVDPPFCIARRFISCRRAAQGVAQHPQHRRAGAVAGPLLDRGPVAGPAVPVVQALVTLPVDHVVGRPWWTAIAYTSATAHDDPDRYHRRRGLSQVNCSMARPAYRDRRRPAPGPARRTYRCRGCVTLPAGRSPGTE